MKDDKRLIFKAAAQAQRAADHLHGYQAKPEAVPEPVAPPIDPAVSRAENRAKQAAYAARRAAWVASLQQAEADCKSAPKWDPREN